ncbi:MAG: Uma2 family endonuclease [Flammeovirgaceae bacterium]
MQPKTQKNHFTFEEYVLLEKENQTRYHFFHGEVFAMAGGTKRHNRIVLNTSFLLEQMISNKKCQVFAENIKLELEKELHYVYPDILLTCHPQDLMDDNENMIRHPSLIVEVISGSTKEYDTKEKKSNYFRIKSLQYYLLIFQNEPLVEVYERCEDFWKLKIYEGTESIIHLEKMNILLNIKDLYKGVSF